jgi:hypothetical protein
MMLVPTSTFMVKASLAHRIQVRPPISLPPAIPSLQILN